MNETSSWGTLQIFFRKLEIFQPDRTWHDKRSRMRKFLTTANQNTRPCPQPLLSSSSRAREKKGRSKNGIQCLHCSKLLPSLSLCGSHHGPLVVFWLYHVPSCLKGSLTWDICSCTFPILIPTRLLSTVQVSLPSPGLTSVWYPLTQPILFLHSFTAVIVN